MKVNESRQQTRSRANNPDTVIQKSRTENSPKSSNKVQSKKIQKKTVNPKRSIQRESVAAAVATWQDTR